MKKIVQADIRNTTVMLDGTECAVKFYKPFRYYEVCNQTNAEVYISVREGLQPDEDGVLTIPAGVSATLAHMKDDADTVFIVGTGKVQVAAKNNGEAVFKIRAKGGGNGNLKVGDKRKDYKFESNWLIQTNGVAKADSSHAIAYYAVTPYSAIYVKALDNSNECKFVWTNTDNVSATDTRYNIGKPVTGVVDEIIVVPAGANYISFSQLKTDTETGVYKLEEIIPTIKLDVYLDYSGEIFRYGSRNVTRSSELPAYCAYYWKDNWFIPCVISEYEEAVAYRMYVEDSSSQGSIEYRGKTWYYNMFSGGSYQNVYDSSNYNRYFLGNYSTEEGNNLKPVYDLLDLLKQIGEV